MSVFEFGVFALGSGAPDWGGGNGVCESHPWHVASEGVEGGGLCEGECTEGACGVVFGISAARGLQTGGEASGAKRPVADVSVGVKIQGAAWRKRPPQVRGGLDGADQKKKTGETVRGIHKRVASVQKRTPTLPSLASSVLLIPKRAQKWPPPSIVIYPG